MQRAFIVEIYIKQKFYTNGCCSKFRSLFSSAPFPSKSTTYRIVDKFRIFSLLKEKRGRALRVPSGETVDTGTHFEAHPRKC